MVPLILQLADLFRKQIAANEAMASARVVESFAAIFERLQPQLIEALAAAQKSGATPADAFGAERLQSIVSQLSGELDRATSHAGDVLTARQRELVKLASDHAQQLTRAALGPAPAGFAGPTWSHLPVQSLQNLVGTLGDGTPVHRILGEIAGAGANDVRAAIVTGLGAGQTPGEIVKGIKGHVGGSMARTLTVIRTEDMRSYREAQRQAFEENDDVVKGWRWWSSKSFDTCAACLSNHGREFPIGQPMDSHPNCRCIAIPITKNWAELGHPELKERAEVNTETGDEWLRKQPEDIQRRALGPSKFEAWKAGDIELQDLCQHRTNPTWGGMHCESSLKDALTAATKRKEAAAAVAKAVAEIAPDPLSKKLFGGRTKVTITDSEKVKVDAFTKKHFGRKFTKKDWGRLAGAPAGTKLTVSTSYNGEIFIQAEANSHVKILNRAIKLDDRGKPYLYNAHFEAQQHPDPDNPGRFKSSAPNFGTRLLAQQVEAARKLGFTRIHTSAAGDIRHRRFNGYYTWPRLGYNAPLPGDKLRLLRAEHPEWQDVTDLHGLMLKPDGPAWWKQKGSSIEVDFDLTDGSDSMQRHKDYLDAIGVRPVGLK